MDTASAAALSALDAASVSQQVTADNLANMNTPGFAPSQVALGDLPESAGVSVLAVYGGSCVLPGGLTLLPNGAEGAPYAASGTDPAREMVQLMLNERTVEANAAVIRAQEEMAGTVLDLTA